MAEPTPLASQPRSNLRWVAAVIALLATVCVATVATLACLKIVQKKAKQSAMQSIVERLDSLAEEINHGFQVHRGRVVFESGQPGAFLPKKRLTPVKGADVVTFRTFDQQFPAGGPRVYYGADSRQVFYHAGGTTGVLDAEPASFRLLDPAGRFACDDANVYYLAIKIEGANPKTFRRLKGDFSVDDDQAFLGHVCLPAEATSFQAFSHGSVWDAWLARRHKSQPSIEGWCGDAQHIYFGDKRMEGIDAASFQYLGYRGYAKDINHVYYEENVVPGADVASFEVLGSKYWKIYPVTLANPSGSGPDARDASCAYQYGGVYEMTIPWEDGQVDPGQEQNSETRRA